MGGDLAGNPVVFGAGKDVALHQVGAVVVRTAGDDAMSGRVSDSGKRLQIGHRRVVNVDRAALAGAFVAKALNHPLHRGFSVLGGLMGGFGRLFTNGIGAALLRSATGKEEDQEKTGRPATHILFRCAGGALPQSCFQQTAEEFPTFHTVSVARRYNLCMFFGTHLLLFSRDAEADRAFFRDVLEVPAVDAGEGWLIFRMPPTEMGIHPAGSSSPAGDDGIAAVSLYLMCRDLGATIGRLAAKGVQCTPPHDAGWGITTAFNLPGGSKIGLYQPRHPVAVETES